MQGVTVSEFISTHPGLESSGAVQYLLGVDEAEGMWGYAPTRLQGWMERVIPLMFLCPGLVPYVAGDYTVTGDNSSTVARIANGLRFQTDSPATDNDDISITGLNTKVLAQDKVLFMLSRLQVSSAANLGVSLGIVTSSTTEVYTSPPADGVYITKGKASATGVLGAVRENSQTADTVTIEQDASGTDLTMSDATDVILGFICKAGASAAESWGGFYCKVAAFNNKGGLVIPFTSDQLTALRTMLATTPPTLAAHIGFRVNGTTQRNGLVNWAYAGIDR